MGEEEDIYVSVSGREGGREGGRGERVLVRWLAVLKQEGRQASGMGRQAEGHSLTQTTYVRAYVCLFKRRAMLLQA